MHECYGMRSQRAGVVWFCGLILFSLSFLSCVPFALALHLHSHVYFDHIPSSNVDSGTRVECRGTLRTLRWSFVTIPKPLVTAASFLSLISQISVAYEYSFIAFLRSRLHSPGVVLGRREYGEHCSFPSRTRTLSGVGELSTNCSLFQSLTRSHMCPHVCVCFFFSSR
jgi:hypothetical protein